MLLRFTKNLVKRILAWVALIGAACLGMTTVANAQGIVLDQADILARLDADLAAPGVFVINGTKSSWHGVPENELVPAGSFQKTLLALTALRLIDRGTINLDTDVSTLVPKIVESGPFITPITLKHLMQETAGFASPPTVLSPRLLDGPMDHRALKRFAIRLRSPGQASSHDPVGWAVLIAALEAASGKEIDTLLSETLLAPLELTQSDMQLERRSLAAAYMPLDLKLHPDAFTALARLLIRNRTPGGERFLSYNMYRDLTQGLTGFRLHPLGDIASFGVSIRRKGLHSWIEPLNADCSSATHHLAFPVEGAVFGAVSSGQECMPQHLGDASLNIARSLFPGRPAPTPSGPPLAAPSKLEGRYIQARRSPAWLKERLALLQADKISVFGHRGETVLVRIEPSDPRAYREKSAYIYEPMETGNGTAPELTFSPFMLGGYASKDGTLYRRVDILGAAGSLERMLPWALLLVASAGFYLFGGMGKAWRNMALFGLVGAGLVGGGLYLELTAWPTVLYEMGAPWLAQIWRIGLNVGVMLVLAMPMFVMSFARKHEIPNDISKLYVPIHLTAIAVAALAVFFTLILWGVAGTFSAY